MSYDLFFFTPEEKPVLKENLAQLLCEVGWEVRYMTDLQRDSGPAVLRPATGALEESQLVMGWRQDWPHAEEFATLFRVGDVPGIYDLADACEMLAGCALTVTLEAVGESGSTAPATGVAYYLRTGAGRTPLSFAWQRSVWRALGCIAGGVLMDPQDEDGEESVVAVDMNGDPAARQDAVANVRGEFDVLRAEMAALGRADRAGKKRLRFGALALALGAIACTVYYSGHRSMGVAVLGFLLAMGAYGVYELSKKNG